MTVREILKMGDPRLLRVAPPVREFDTPELHALISDMFDTMEAARGAGLAAPQIGVDPAGAPLEREVDGFHAGVVQHESDHLIGRLYPTRMVDLTQLGYTSVLFPELVDADDE